MIDPNVYALHDLTVAASQTCAIRKAGAIVNVASVVALMTEQFKATHVPSMPSCLP